MSRAAPIPVSKISAGTFFIVADWEHFLFFVTRIKANGRPEIRKMSDDRVCWDRAETAYGVKGAVFASPDSLVLPLTRNEVLEWNRHRFVLTVEELYRQEIKKALTGLSRKAFATRDKLRREAQEKEESDWNAKFKALHGQLLAKLEEMGAGQGVIDNCEDYISNRIGLGYLLADPDEILHTCLNYARREIARGGIREPRTVA